MEASNRRRSERVVLRVPVQLSAIMPGGKRMCIEAHTLSVEMLMADCWTSGWKWFEDSKFA